MCKNLKIFIIVRSEPQGNIFVDIRKSYKEAQNLIVELHECVELGTQYKIIEKEM